MKTTVYYEHTGTGQTRVTQGYVRTIRMRTQTDLVHTRTLVTSRSDALPGPSRVLRPTSRTLQRSNDQCRAPGQASTRPEVATVHKCESHVHVHTNARVSLRAKQWRRRIRHCAFVEPPRRSAYNVGCYG